MILKNIQKSSPTLGKWCPKGGLDLPFGPCLGSHVAPSAPWVDFYQILGFIGELILSPKSLNFGVDFRYVFWMLFGRVLERSGGCFGCLLWCQKGDQTEKGRGVEMIVLFQ